jgi:type II secretory pathway pseudopilin PulG
MYIAAGQPSGKATASLICGIFFFFWPAAVCAIILGHIALSEIKKSAGRLIGEGRAIAGLVLGYLGLAAIPLILIIAAIAIPNLLRARIAANEASAVSSIRAINTAESTYQSAYPNVGYTCSFAQLGVDNVLATGRKHGYRFRITDCTRSGGDTTGFKVIASPLQPGTTGVRTFCSDQTGIIKSISQGTAEACLADGTPFE